MLSGLYEPDGQTDRSFDVMKSTSRRAFTRIAVLGGAFMAGNWFGLFGRDFAYPTMAGSLLVAFGVYGLLHEGWRHAFGPVEALYLAAATVAGLLQLKWMGYFASQPENRFLLVIGGAIVLVAWVVAAIAPSRTMHAHRPDGHTKEPRA